MALKIAINGFGRIGRCVTRLIAARNDVELVAINDMASIDMMLYLLQNDSVHGSLETEVMIDDPHPLLIRGKPDRKNDEKNQHDLDFGALGGDVVFE